MGRQSGARRVREKTTAEGRREQVAKLYLEGWMQFPIAQKLGVVQQTISDDLAIIRKEWLEQRTVAYDDHMMRQLVGLDAQESQLWEAWYRSCQTEVISTKSLKRQLQQADKPKSKRKSKQTDDSVSSVSKMVVVEENEKTVTRQMVGDPRFMAEITRLRELRCKLLGLLEDEKPSSPIVNIWQQLQDMHFDRDKDEIEDAIAKVKMLPPISHVIDRPLDDAGLKDVSGWKEPTDNGHNDDGTPNGFKQLDDDNGKVIPTDDTPLDID